MLPNSSDIEYFLETADTGNISRAAERLGITQPSLSLSIRRLEQSLGAALLVRMKTGVHLTTAGQRFVGQARKLLSEWKKIKSEALNVETEICGRYTLGSHPSVAVYSLNTFMAAILKEYPDLEIHLKHDLSRRITEAVISFEIDFGIVVNPVAHPDLVIRPLCTDEVSLWTSSAPTATQDLAGPKGILIYDPELLQSQSLLNSMKKRSLEFRRTLHSSNLEVITSLVASGTGVGILPQRVATYFPELKLKPYSATAPKYSDRICLIYRADNVKTETGRLIAGTIEKSFKGKK